MQKTQRMEHCSRGKKMKKKLLILITTLSVFLCLSCRRKEHIDTLTYAVFPHLPDSEYYQELIEQCWKEIEPDIRLIRKDWDCYYDGAPDGIDVIMYDAVMLNALIDAGWIQPIDRNNVQSSEDIFPFALDGLTMDGKLYGIPVFLCGNFLIYDRSCTDLAAAEHFTDFSDKAEILVINSEDDFNRKEYAAETLADIQGIANPVPEGDPDETVSLIDQLAIEKHKNDSDEEVAAAYDSGIGKGYIGYSESLRYLNGRLEDTDIKSISFSDRENVLRLYTDAAVLTAGVEGQRREKALELMNVMADSAILSALSLQEGKPQYLLIARKSLYADLIEEYPIYSRLEELAADQNNHVIVDSKSNRQSE